jgi:hypothetical protein
VIYIAGDNHGHFDHIIEACKEHRPSAIISVGDITETLPLAPAFIEAVARYHAQPGCPWHHALHDVRAFLVGWKTMRADGKSRISKPGEFDV